MKQYISDIITKNEIAKWKPGNIILLDSQTGTGKSQMIKDVLYEYCKETHKKILLLSNRTLLKNQNLEEIGKDKLDIITLKNYQSLETSILSGKDIEVLFNNYDYICYDECHYLLADSEFNRNTDILMQVLRSPLPNKVFIFISATPEAILTYQKHFDFHYTIQKDYSYITDLYFYSKNETVSNILEKLPSDDKAIYFGTALEAFELSMNTLDSAFICSESNKEFNRKSSKSTVREIIQENTFRSKVLCSTKVLDNGINILDKNIKHVFIDMIDPIDLIQCLGRKRVVDSEDTITLYVKNFHGGEIYPKIQYIDSKLKLAEEIQDIGKEQFQKKYARQDFDTIIQNDFEINQAKLYYNRYLKDILLRMIAHEEKDGYQKTICKWLGYNPQKIKIAEVYYEKEQLVDILEKFSNRRLYKGEEQETFKEKFFEKLFDPRRKIDYRSRGINSINAMIQEDSLPYYIGCSRDRSRGSHRDKYYWIINRILQENE